MKKFLTIICVLTLSNVFAQTPECHWVSRSSSQALSWFDAVNVGSDRQVYGASINQGFGEYHSFYDTTQIVDEGGGINITLSRHNQAGSYIWQKRLYGLYDAYDVEMELDSADNIYLLTTIFGGTIDFDPSLASDFILNPGQSRAICVAKYNPDGEFIWARKFGISDTNFARELNILPSGNLLISGIFTDSIDLGNLGAPLVFNANGINDVFVLELDDATGQTINAQQFGLEGNTDVYSQCVDASGNYYLLLNYTSILDVDPGPGIIYAEPSNGINYKIAMVKYNNTGNLLWLKQLQNDGFHIGNTIQVNSLGEIYFIGQAVNEFNYDLNPDPLQTYYVSSSIPGSIAYLVKLNSNGDFLWARTWDTNVYGFTSDFSNLRFDQDGNIYINGQFYQSVDMDPGPDVFTISAPTNFLTNNPNNPFTYYLLSLNDDGDFRYAFPICDSLSNIESVLNFSVSSDGNELYLVGAFQPPFSFKVGDSRYTFPDTLNPLLMQGYIAEYSICPIRVNEDQVTTCDSSFSWNGNTYTETGTYFNIYQNEDLCDSIDILRFTKTIPTSANLNLLDCNPLIINNQIFSQSGNYTQTLVNEAGCDSVINIYFQLLGSTSAEIYLEACESITINGITYSNTGIYSQTITNSNGCDSILTIEAEIQNFNAQIFQTDTTLYFNGNPTSIQWFNCLTGQIIPGENNPVFIPQQTGNYGAIITIGECVDTSNCNLIPVPPIPKSPPDICENINVFPNPVIDQVSFTLDKESYSINLFTSTGALVWQKMGTPEKQEIDFRNYAPALYVLEVDQCRFKIVKQ